MKLMSWDLPRARNYDPAYLPIQLRKCGHFAASVALAVLVCFSLFVQMAEGTSHGIVPFTNRN